MNFEDIVAIIFVIIFFVGPLIKRIAEAAGKQEDAPKKGRSLEEVREYLERMKSSQAPSEPTQPYYRAPATTPYKSSTREKPSAKKRSAKEEVVAQPVVAPVVIAQEAPEAPSVKKAIEKNILHDFMSSTRFTEVQKAIILAEIFKQPT